MILVTGVSGLVGKHLTQKLLSKEHSVIGLTNNKDKCPNEFLKNENFKLVEADIRNRELIDKIFKSNDIKTIFHTVAHMPYSPNPDFVGVNVKGTNNLLWSANNNRVEHFIYCSSISVYNKPPIRYPVDEKHPTNPMDTYGRTKLCAELMCNQYKLNMRITILRFAGIYGLGMENNRVIPKFIRQAKNNEPLTLDGDGTHTRDFVYVKDVVEGIYLAWQKKATGIFNLGSGQPTSMIELATLIKQFTNSKSEIVLSGNMGQSFNYVLDIGKAKKAFGFKPRPFKEGLYEYIKEQN